MRALSRLMQRGKAMNNRTEIQNSTITDERIVELYWQRDQNAIKETDKKYGKMLIRIAYNILHDMSDCEECQNDTYLRIWNAIPPNRPNPFSAFIYKIMRNSAINKYKEKSRKSRIPSEFTVSIEDLEDSLHSAESPESEISAKELSELINHYLSGLSDRQKYIFIGRFYMGDTLETIAEELKINASTVQRETEKIKKGLKAYLERSGYHV